MVTEKEYRWGVKADVAIDWKYSQYLKGMFEQ